MPNAPQLHLRPATLEDAETLLVWRNDSETRRNSRTIDEVAWEGHIMWLQKTLSGAIPTRMLYIALHDGTPVGTVRSDKGEDDMVELSWTIAPSARGKGFGKVMVTQFAAEIHPGKKLLASIRKGNIASEKIAQALGLHQAEPEFPDDADEYPLMLWR